jgi:hypothetical protein
MVTVCHLGDGPEKEEIGMPTYLIEGTLPPGSSIPSFGEGINGSRARSDFNRGRGLGPRFCR